MCSLRRCNMYLKTYDAEYILFLFRGKYFSTPNSSLNLMRLTQRFKMSCWRTQIC